MLEYLKEYILLVPHICSTTALFLLGLRKRIFFKWGALWLGVWSIAYLVKGIYGITLFIFFLGTYISLKTRGERAAYYFLLVPTLPLFLTVDLPGFFGIKSWIPLNIQTLLAVFVLLPLAINAFFFGSARDALLSFKTDKYVVLYFLVLAALSFRNPTFTSGLRSLTTEFLSVFVPYYAISRALKKREDFELAFYAVAFSGMIVASVGIMEESLRWSMFVGLAYSMNLSVDLMATYTMRAGLLKIGSTFASGTACGYFLSSVIAISFYLKNFSKLDKKLLYLIAVMCLVTIFFTASRGAWLGLLILAAIIAMYQKGKKVKLILMLLLVMYIIFPLLNYTPAGHAITRKLEQIIPSSKEAKEYETIDYRQRLISASFKTMARNPWFGAMNFLQAEEMQELKQGQGIIDIVNTYFQVGLSYGWVGLVLFASIFITTAGNLFILANDKKLRRKNEYFSQMIVTFLAISVMTIVVVGTVSSVSLLPHYYWAFTGVAAAIIRVATSMKKNLST